MTVRFISDLHLSPARPDITALFLEFLATDARRSAALYILGDLFDAWLGDDDTSAFAVEIKQGLKRLTKFGVPVYFMAGNRDFLVGQDFADATGVVILPEGHTLRLFGQRILLLHGDSLCTADKSYQRFRRVIRHPLVTGLLTRLPLKWRMGIAARLRANSKTQQPLSGAQLQIMDVTESAVLQAFATHQVDMIIHGHTHRPAIHNINLADDRKVQRVVLGDWYEQGSILELHEEDLELISAPLPTAT